MDRTQHEQSLYQILTTYNTYIAGGEVPVVLYYPQPSKASEVTPPTVYISSISLQTNVLTAIEKTNTGSRYFPKQQMLIDCRMQDPVSYLSMFKMWLRSSAGEWACASKQIGIRVDGNISIQPEDLGTSIANRAIMDVTVTLQQSANFANNHIKEVGIDGN